MKLAILTLTAVFAVPSIALACGDHAKVQQAAADAPMCDHATVAVKTTTVKEVAAWNKTKAITPVDANGKETRAKMGVIPGARLLTSSTQFAATELPASKDSKLVFYCANTRCQASHQAAQRAVDFGYTDVSVLPDGIKGWVDAGQATEKPSAPRS
jgi:rhodanese-related sulfurtransferase